MIIDTISPLYSECGKVAFCKEPEKKPELEDALMVEFCKVLDFFEPMIKDGKWLTGDKICTGDFMLGNIFTNIFNNPISSVCPDKFKALLPKYPNF